MCRVCLVDGAESKLHKLADSRLGQAATWGFGATLGADAANAVWHGIFK